MPGTPPFNKSPHQVLQGRGSDRFCIWVDELKEAAKATGCLDHFFPKLTPEGDIEEWFARHSEGTWQNLAWKLQKETTVRILAAFVSGPMWAYLLIRSPDDDPPLLSRPHEVVKMAEVASVRFPLAPRTERERNRMLYELENGDPDVYPSDEHFQHAKDWLETAVLLSTSKEAIAERRRARDAPSPVPVKLEVAQGPSLAEIPNSSARRRRRRETEGTPDGSERRRIKVEP